MERALYKWYKSEVKEGRTVTARKVKDMAIKMSTCGDFIASKGWLDKFKVRYRLDIQKESSNQPTLNASSGQAVNCKGEQTDSSEEPPEGTGGDSDSDDLIESDDDEEGLGQISSESGDNDDLVDSDDQVQKNQTPTKRTQFQK